MRVLFAMSNWPGHFYPMVGQGWALQAAGHQVVVACTAADADAVRATGLTPAPVLDAPEMNAITRVRGVLQLRAGTWNHPAPPPHPLTGEPVADADEVDFGAVLAPLTRIARRSNTAALQLARAWHPDLVVHDPLSFEGQLIARALDIPAVVQLWGPVGIAEDEPELSLTPNDYGNALAGLGAGGVDFGKVAAVLDPCPPALSSRNCAPALGTRFVPFNGAGHADLPVLPNPRRRPRICLVWGNSVSAIFGAANSPVAALTRALGQVDADVLIALNRTDAAALLPQLPANATLLDYTPLHLLLPHCDLVVHSSGGGCATTAMLSGTPQLLVPNGLDQPLIARRITAAGAGRTVPSWDANPATVGDALDDLLNNGSYRDAAEVLGAAARALPTPAARVADLIDIAAGATIAPLIPRVSAPTAHAAALPGDPIPEAMSAAGAA